MPNTAIDPVTIAAYLGANYCVEGEPGFTMRIGQTCPALGGLYASEGVACCAFISACNPQGERLSDARNHERQAHFAGMLRARGLRHLAGAGCDPEGAWQSEPSYLVLGVTLDQARAIGQELHQNAIVWCGADCLPALILLR